MLVLLPHRSRALPYQKGPYPSLLSISTPSVLWKGNQLIYFQSCSFVYFWTSYKWGHSAHSFTDGFFLSLNTARFIHVTAYGYSSFIAYPGPGTTLLSFISTSMYICTGDSGLCLFIHLPTSKKSYTIYTSVSGFFGGCSTFYPYKPCYCMSQFLSTVMLLSILQTHYILSLLLLIRIWIVFYFEATMNQVLWTFLNMLLVDICPHFSLSIYPGMSHTVYICFIFSKNCQFSKVVLTNY